MAFMSITVGVSLSIDVGVTRIRAVLGWPDGAVRVVTFDGQSWLSAQVWVGEHGRVLVGAAAVRAGRDRPDGLVSPVPELTRPAVTVAGREVDPVVLVGELARAVV